MKELTNGQWFKILDLHLGLRSEDNASVINNCASYAMDMGLTWVKSPHAPADWNDLLTGTLEMMKAFDGSEKRYLMLVGNSCGNEKREYRGCFPKCSTRPTYYSSISLDNDIEVLREWVLSEIDAR